MADLPGQGVPNPVESSTVGVVLLIVTLLPVLCDIGSDVEWIEADAAVAVHLAKKWFM